MANSPFIYGPDGSLFIGQPLPTTGQVLTAVDNIGNLNWQTPGGGASPTTFTLSNNVTSPTDITGFSVNPSSYSAFTADALTIINVASSTIITDAEDTAFYTNLGSAFNSEVVQVIEQTNSQIVAVGNFTTFDGNTRNRLVRLNSDGTEDTAFYTNLGTSASGILLSVAEQSNAQLVVGGSFNSFNGTSAGSLVRLNSDGTQDSTFDTNLGTGFSGDVISLAIQSNQQVLVGGDFTVFNGGASNFLERLNTDGTEDTTFHSNIGSGFSGGGSSVQSVLVQSNQQIVVGGTYTTFNGNSRGSLVRLNSDGTEDTAFATNIGTGFTSGGGAGTVNTVIQQTNGQLLVGGSFDAFNGATTGSLVRLNTDGTVDSIFATAIGTGFNNAVNSLDLQGTNIIAAGAFTNFNSNTSLYLARLSSAGSFDSAFETSLGSSFGSAVATVAVQTNSQILAGGSFTLFNGTTRDRLIRYETLSTSPAAEYVSWDTIKGIYHSTTSAWILDIVTSVGDPTGITLSMTNAGQLQYTSKNFASFTSGSFKFLITRTF